LKTRYQNRATDHDDDPDGDDESVVTRHDRAELGKRRTLRERGPRVSGDLDPR
jgi:hypothetical protein